MRFSIWPDSSRPFSDIAELVTHCEATGWDGAYLADHFMPDASEPAGEPVLECWTALAALGALTNRLRLGSLVSSNTYRHPAVLANAAATIDRITDGRLVLGIGAGWQETEHDAYGLELYDVATRSDRLEEACAVINLLLRQDRSTFDGVHYSLRDAPCDPKPVQNPLPLLVAGKGERRTMPTAARYADEWNGWCTSSQFRAKRAVLDRLCEAIDRDPAEVLGSTQALLFLSDDREWIERRRVENARYPLLIGSAAEIADQVADYAAAGVDELIVPDWTLGPLAQTKDVCDRLINEIAAPFR